MSRNDRSAYSVRTRAGLDDLVTAQQAVAFEDTEVDTWFERDRASVVLRDKATQQITYAEWWDEDVQQAVEDGFLNANDWHRSAYETAVSQGLITQAGQASDADYYARDQQSGLSPEQQEIYNSGWQQNGEWTCPVCGTMIGKNLNNESPYGLAREHAQTHDKAAARTAQFSDQLKSKWERVKGGERVVFGDEELDDLQLMFGNIGYGLDESDSSDGKMFWDRFVTDTNPEQVGTLDQWIGYLKQGAKTAQGDEEQHFQGLQRAVTQARENYQSVSEYIDMYFEDDYPDMDKGMEQRLRDRILVWAMDPSQNPFASDQYSDVREFDGARKTAASMTEALGHAIDAGYTHIVTQEGARPISEFQVPPAVDSWGEHSFVEDFEGGPAIVENAPAGTPGGLWRVTKGKLSAMEATPTGDTEPQISGPGPASGGDGMFMDLEEGDLTEESAKGTLGPGGSGGSNYQLLASQEDYQSGWQYCESGQGQELLTMENPMTWIVQNLPDVDKPGDFWNGFRDCSQGTARQAARENDLFEDEDEELGPIPEIEPDEYQDEEMVEEAGAGSGTQLGVGQPVVEEKPSNPINPLVSRAQKIAQENVQIGDKVMYRLSLGQQAVGTIVEEYDAEYWNIADERGDERPVAKTDVIAPTIAISKLAQKYEMRQRLERKAQSMPEVGGDRIDQALQAFRSAMSSGDRPPSAFLDAMSEAQLTADEVDVFRERVVGEFPKVKDEVGNPFTAARTAQDVISKISQLDVGAPAEQLGQTFDGQWALYEQGGRYYKLPMEAFQSAMDLELSDEQAKEKFRSYEAQEISEEEMRSLKQSAKTADQFDTFEDPEILRLIRFFAENGGIQDTQKLVKDVSDRGGWPEVEVWDQLVILDMRGEIGLPAEMVAARAGGKTASQMRYCEFFLASDEKWYMMLAPNEYGTASDAIPYGPFGTLEEAKDFLDNFSNPGGWDVDDSGAKQPPKDPKKSIW